MSACITVIMVCDVFTVTQPVFSILSRRRAAAINSSIFLVKRCSKTSFHIAEQRNASLCFAFVNDKHLFHVEMPTGSVCESMLNLIWFRSRGVLVCFNTFCLSMARFLDLEHPWKLLTLQRDGEIWIWIHKYGFKYSSRWKGYCLKD